VADDFSRLVSLACHDLRTPLATVSGFAKTMLRLDELEDDKRDRYLGLIDTAADELAELLDLLSLAARIEGGRYDPVVREVHAKAPHAHVVQGLERFLQPGSVRIARDAAQCVEHDADRARSRL